MKNKNEKEAEKASLELREKQLRVFGERVIRPVRKLHQARVTAFKDNWGIPEKGFKSENSLCKWYKNIQKEHPEKKYDVITFELEEFYILEGSKIVDTVYSPLFEENPRVTNLGGSPEVVFDYEVKKLMNDLNLDPDWATLFKQYLLFGDSFPEMVKIPSVVISERITVGEDREELEHRIALNISPNTPQEEIRLLWRPVVEGLQKKIRGRWLGKRRRSESMRLLEKLIELDDKDKKRDKKISSLEKANILFGDSCEEPKYESLGLEEIGKLDAKRIRKVKNLRRHYKKLLRAH